MTRLALLERCVHDVFFSDRFADEHVDAPEEVVTAAYEQKARCDAVRGPAAERLDSTGGGIGALLRFPLPVRDLAEVSTPAA